jgi:hypothetical protein
VVGREVRSQKPESRMRPDAGSEVPPSGFWILNSGF